MKKTISTLVLVLSLALSAAAGAAETTAVKPETLPLTAKTITAECSAGWQLRLPGFTGWSEMTTFTQTIGITLLDDSNYKLTMPPESLAETPQPWWANRFVSTCKLAGEKRSHGTDTWQHVWE